MIKITAIEARKLLSRGFFPKCQVSRAILKPVKSEQELENFLNLSSVQGCQFYGYDEKDIKEFKVPDNALSMSINEAADMIVSGEKVYARIIGENEQSFSDFNSFASFIRKCSLYGDSLLLYWYE